MMTSLKVVLQFAIVSIAFAELAPEQRELMAGGSAPSSGASASPSGSAQGIPAHDAHGDASGGEQEATNSDKSEGTGNAEAGAGAEPSPWSTEVVATLITVLSVLFLVFGIGLSLAVYKVSQKEAKTQEKAPAPQVVGDTEEKKFGHVHSDASTAASESPLNEQV
jgi:hypothetical protein